MQMLGLHSPKATTLPNLNSISTCKSKSYKNSHFLHPCKTTCQEDTYYMLINTIVHKRLPCLVNNPQHKGFIQCHFHGPKCQVPIKPRKNNCLQVPLLINLHNTRKPLLVNFDHLVPKGVQGHGRKKGGMHVHVLGIEDKTQFITLMSYVASKNNASFPSHLFGKTKLTLSPRNHGSILFLKYSYKHWMNLQICKIFLN